MQLRRARPLLGTLVEIRIDTELSQQQAQLAIRMAFEGVARVQKQLSYHDPDSELSRINREGFYRPVPVSRAAWEVLQAAQGISKQSNGLFDVTIGPLLGRYGFLPVHEGCPKIDVNGNWQDIELLPDQRVRLRRRVNIDLGGIAKGYAVDRAVSVLLEQGIESGCVNAGGDMRVFGGKPQPLHIRHPLRSTELIAAGKVDRAAATSGIYYSGRLQDGKRVTPLIDPRQSAACTTERSVTILADGCMTADALTKVFYAEPGSGEQLLARFNARALIMEADEQGLVPRVIEPAGFNQSNRARANERLYV